MEFQTILFEMRETSAIIRLNRPKAMNAVNGQMVEEIGLALDEAENEPALRGLVLTGEGKEFCAGADLKFVLSELESGRPLREGFLGNVCRLLTRLEAFPMPTIAAVNGLALAGGLELLLCCDLIVAVESATIGDAHSNYGMIPGGGATQRLPRRLGNSRAKQLLFLGRSYSARDLQQWGLVNMVVPDGELEQSIESIISTLSEKSPLGLRKMKFLVNRGMESTPREGLELELEAFEEYQGSYDIKEGLQAFKEKRSPVFEGR